MSEARRGMSLTEVVVAVAILAVAGLGLLTMLRTSTRGGARASEIELATVLASRVVDRVLVNGYRAIAQNAGRTAAVDLSGLGVPADQPGTRPGELVVDGFTYACTAAFDEAQPGLMRVRVALTWTAYGVNAPSAAGSLAVLRYAGDPARAVALR